MHIQKKTKTKTMVAGHGKKLCVHSTHPTPVVVIPRQARKRQSVAKDNPQAEKGKFYGATTKRGGGEWGQAG